MAVYVNGKKVAGKGISGKSPYQIAQSEGYTGTEQDFNSQLLAIGEATKGFNELSAQVNNAKAEVQTAVSQAQTDINNTASNAKQEINSAVAGANQVLEAVEQAKDDIETTVDNAKAEIEQAKQDAINSMPNAENLMTSIWSYSATAPSNTKLLWIDSNNTTGGLKYYNGSAWVHVPVAWT